MLITLLTRLVNAEDEDCSDDDDDDDEENIS